MESNKVPLNPTTVRSIRDFARRRRVLIMTRGACAAVICLLGVMGVVALLDYVFVLSDWTRWALSFVGYASVIGVVWFTSIRLLLRSPSITQIAALMETAQPDLHENLVAAVELGSEKSDARWDSPTFRGLLQGTVALKLKDTPIRSLLPNRLIVWWMRIAVVLVVVTAVMLLIPGSPYAKLMARAMVPVANLGRVSNVKVEIVAPNPADVIVPQGDMLAVAARTMGLQSNQQVMLETWRSSQGSEQLRMLPSGSDEFSATLQISREPVRYRVRAGDAVTRWYTIDAQARPHIETFVKVYQYPGYTERASTTVTEDQGDLTALEGTMVDLTLTASQAINSGELIVEENGKTVNTPITLDSSNPKQLHARIAMAASGTYRVRVVAAKSGFENKFSPQYEIRAQPDLIPRVEIDQPRNSVIAPMDDLVSIVGKATDDMSLLSISQAVRVNQGPWKQTQLKDNPGQEVDVAQQLDLMGLGVHAGDQITYKLIAKDRKGNQGESMPLLITISAQGFDPARLGVVEKLQAIKVTLDELARASKYMQEQASAAQLQVSKNADATLRQQSLAGLKLATDQTQAAAAAVLDRIQAAMHVIDDSREAEYLGAVGRIISEMQHQLAQATLIDLARADDKQLPDVMRRIVQRSIDGQKDLTATISAYHLMQASHLATLALGDTNNMMIEQESLKLIVDRDDSKDAGKWDRVARRLQLAKAQMAQVSQTLTQAADLADAATSRSLKGLLANMGKMDDSLDRITNDATPGRRLLEIAKRLEQHLASNIGRLAELHQAMAKQADTQYAQLLRMSGATADGLALLGKQVKVEPTPATLNGRWQAAIGQLEDRAKLDEVRSDADSHFVADMTSGAQAMRDAWDYAGTMREMTADAIERLDAISHAVRVLETGHELEQNIIALRQLGMNEQWRFTQVVTATQSPLAWQWAADRAKELTDAMKQVQFPATASELVSQAYQLPQAAQINEQMAMRGKMQPERTSMSAPLLAVRNNLLVASRQIEPMMDEARRVLGQSASTIAKVAAQLAKEVRELKQKTDQLAEDSAKLPADQVSQKSKELAAAQKDLNERVKQVSDALRRDANVQDLMLADGRARARDDDDAVALLKDPPPKAESHLQQAMANKEAAQQKDNLGKAGEQQDKLADALELIATHQKNLDENKPEETREALRDSEQETGVKQDLDKQYAEMEKLAEMAKQKDQELADSLKKELPINEQMQQELSQIAQDLAQQAQKKLQDAADQEAKINKDMAPMVKQEQKKPTVSAKDVQKIADEAKKLAKQDVPEAAKSADQAKVDSKQQTDAAGKQLENAADKGTEAAKQEQVAAEDVAAMAEALKGAAENLQQAEKRADQAVADAQAKGQQADQQIAQAQQAGQTNPQAAQAKLEAQTEQKAAATAQQEAKEAADKAQALANQAAQLASQAQQAQQQNQQQMADAAQQQAPIGQTAAEAAQDLARAADLGQQMNQDPAGEMKGAAAEAQKAADKDVPGAKKELEKGDSAKEAQEAVAGAQEQLQKAADQAGKAAEAMAAAAASAAAAQPGPPGPPGPPTPGQMMAQAMNEQSQQNAEAAQQAMAAAAAAAAQAMAMARSQASMPGLPMPGMEGPSMQAGAGSTGTGKGDGDLANAALAATGKWGDLPPKLAHDLIESQRETVAPEYREQIDAYFKAIAAKAKDHP